MFVFFPKHTWEILINAQKPFPLPYLISLKVPAFSQYSTCWDFYSIFVFVSKYLYTRQIRHSSTPSPSPTFSQCAQFFIRAHLCKNAGKRRAFFGENTGDNTGKFDLVHVQSVIDLFAKQLNNTLNLN